MEKGHDLIAVVRTSRVNRVGLLGRFGEVGLSTGLGVAVQRRHGIIPAEAGKGRVDTSPEVEVLQSDAIGFAIGLGAWVRTCSAKRKSSRHHAMKKNFMGSRSLAGRWCSSLQARRSRRERNWLTVSSGNCLLQVRERSEVRARSSCT